MMALRPYLTRQERETLKRLVDARVRAQHVTLPGAGGCAGCGRPHAEDGCTTGCSQCWDRMRRRKRREDPVLHERDKQLWREASQRRRDQAGKRAA